ncbi:MAG: hypothetical protein H6726_29780 [Sandaracinaceae bacterium]|nr:hypothetical protein [Sandaracinaceae bacterium]
MDATGQVYPYVRDAAGAVLGKRDPRGTCARWTQLRTKWLRRSSTKAPRWRSSGSTAGWCR